VVFVNTYFTTGMRDGMLKAFEKNTSIEVAKVKRERLRDGGRKPAFNVNRIKISTYTNVEVKLKKYSCRKYLAEAQDFP